MALSEWLSGLGDRFTGNISAAGPQGLASLGAAIAGAPRNQWGTGLAQGLAQYSQLAQTNKKKASLAEALKGAMGQSDMSPLQRTLIEQYPDLAVPEIAKGIFDKPKAVEQPNDVREYEYAKGQGYKGTFQDWTTQLKKAGASNVNVNNLPAEVGARLGLAGGFLERYDTIHKDLEGLNTLTGRAQLIFNTGKGAEVKRHIESGAEALIRQLTGAGKSQEEAQSYASRYLPGALDTAFDLKSKLEGLKYDLEHTASGIYKAKGGTYTSPAANSKADLSDVDAILGLK